MSINPQHLKKNACLRPCVAVRTRLHVSPSKTPRTMDGSSFRSLALWDFMVIIYNFTDFYGDFMEFYSDFMEFYCDFMEFYGDIMGFNGYFVESNEI